MFNKQKLYGQPLSVQMLKPPAGGILLPKGLADIGPGFGVYGKPLRDIVKEYEKFALNKTTLINTIMFRKIDEMPSVEVNYDENDNSDADIGYKDVTNKQVDSIKVHDKDFLKRRRFLVRSVEKSDSDSDDESSKKHFTNRSISPESRNSAKMSFIRSNTRSNSVGLSSNDDDDDADSNKPISPLARSSHLKPAMPQNPVGYRCPEPQSIQSSTLPIPNPSHGYSMGPRPIRPLPGPNNPMIRPPLNATNNFMPNQMPMRGTIPNLVAPVPGPITNGPIGPRGPMSGPIGPVPGPSNVPLPGSIGPPGCMPGPAFDPRTNMSGPIPNCPVGPVKSATLQFRNVSNKLTYFIFN